MLYLVCGVVCPVSSILYHMPYYLRLLYVLTLLDRRPMYLALIEEC